MPAGARRPSRSSTSRNFSRSCWTPRQPPPSPAERLSTPSARSRRGKAPTRSTPSPLATPTSPRRAAARLCRTVTAPMVSMLRSFSVTHERQQRTNDGRRRVPELWRALAPDDEPARALPLRLLPAPLRAALRVPELRHALDDRAGDGPPQHHLQPVRVEPAQTPLKKRVWSLTNPREEALRRLAEKQVRPAYRPPRGNADLDRDALNVSVAASERLLTH